MMGNFSWKSCRLESFRKFAETHFRGNLPEAHGASEKFCWIISRNFWKICWKFASIFGKFVENFGKIVGKYLENFCKTLGNFTKFSREIFWEIF